MPPIDPTTSGMVEKWAARSADSPAIIDTSGMIISYRDLSEIISSWKQALTHQGISNGSRVAVVLPNGSDIAATFLGITSVATCVPLNPSYSRDEFFFYLQDTGCAELLVGDNYPIAAEEAAQDLGIPCYKLRPIKEILFGASPIYGEMHTHNPMITPVEPDSHPEDSALILHTSGTTGKPKRVPLRQDRICRNAAAIAGSLHLTPADRCLNLMPLFHVHGLVGCLLATLHSGGAIITTPGFQSDKIAGWLHDFEPTWLSAVPAIHHSLLRVLGNYEEFVHHLRFIRSCSAPLPPSLLQKMEERFKVPVIEAYGMTEASHQIASNPLPPAPHKPGSVGIPTGYTIRIQDRHGQECGPDMRGEVWIFGKNLFSGYEDNPAVNAEEFHKGFFRTGDEGYIDPDGYLFLTGRLKELINKGGEKVAPREIEEVFLRCTGVDQAVAFGIPHRELGEDIGLIIVPSPGYELALTNLKQHALQHLAPWKVPSKIQIMDEVPKGPTGKVRRRELAALLSDLDRHHEPQYHNRGGETPSILEEQIQKIWEKALQHSPIGLDEDFFSIGGYSLTAMAITTELERAFAVELAPTILFSAPTIRELTAVIAGERLGGSLPTLVPFQEKGDLTPLFLVPPGHGNAFFYQDFAALLESDQPFYSFSRYQMPKSTSSIEGIAARNVDEIIRIKPEGPFLVGGYCFGAVVALEMAHQLQDRGLEVRGLMIIDPDQLPNGPGWRWDPQRQNWKEFPLWLMRGGPRRWLWFASRFITRIICPTHLSEEQRNHLEVILSNVQMLRNYHARQYTGHALVFHHGTVDGSLVTQWGMVLGKYTESVVIVGAKHHEVLDKGGEQVVEHVRFLSNSTN